MVQQATFVIPTKDSEIEFPQQVIELLPQQLNAIKKQSVKKTTKQWFANKTGIRVLMTEDQKDSVLYFKNQFVGALAPGRTAKELLESGKIGFADHAFDRVDERFLEYYRESEEKSNELKRKLGFPIEKVYYDSSSLETITEILQIFINSDSIDKYFVWKPYPYLSYKFKGRFRNDVIGIVITFSQETTIITLTIEERH